MSLIKWSLHLKLPPLSSWVVHLKHCLQLDIPYSLSFSSGHYFLLLTLVEFDSNYIMAGQRIVWEEEGIMYVHEQIEGPNEEMIELVSEWMGVKEPHEKQDRGREERKQREREEEEKKKRYKVERNGVIHQETYLVSRPWRLVWVLSVVCWVVVTPGISPVLLWAAGAVKHKIMKLNYSIVLCVTLFHSIKPINYFLKILL